MIVYLDIVFFENLCMNYIILFATGLILKKNMCSIRLILSSFLGGTYVVVMYVTKFECLYSVGIKVLLSIAMVYIAFYAKDFKNLIKDLLSFYLVSFVFGGTAFAMIYFIKPQDIVIKDGVYIGTYALNTIFIGAIVAFILVNIVFKIIKRKISRDDISCDIAIEFNKKIVKVRTIIDTGNMLKDPISKKNVAIVEKNIIKKIIPDEIINNIEKFLNGEIVEYENDMYKYVSKFKLIPFKSIGKDNRINISFQTR